MTEKYDVIIIGAGILGCFAARHMAKYALRTAVLEKAEDVCTQITRANSGIIYRGYDQHPGSLKAQMCVKGSAGFAGLCEELDVQYRQCGLLMVGFGPRAEAKIRKKMDQGMQLGIDRLHLLGSKEVYDLEPGLAQGVQIALYSEDTCTADPWELGIAAYENARQNGVEFFFREEVCAIRRQKGGFRIETRDADYEARRVLCCAGLQADRLWDMAAEPRFQILPEAADYIVFDVLPDPPVNHIISVEPETFGEGLTITPTVAGNLLLGPTRRPLTGDADREGFETREEGLRELLDKGRRLIPALPADAVIRSFGAVRPNPFYVEPAEGGYTISSRSIRDFLILQEEGFFSLAGVKTPGITCADELGSYITERIVSSLDEPVAKKADHDPRRRAIPRVSTLTDACRQQLVSADPAYGQILCRCRDVTCGEVLEAIRRGAVTADGVKRRTGALMGRCQGGYCREKIEALLSAAAQAKRAEQGKDGASCCR